MDDGFNSVKMRARRCSDVDCVQLQRVEKPRKGLVTEDQLVDRGDAMSGGDKRRRQPTANVPGRACYKYVQATPPWRLAVPDPLAVCVAIVPCRGGKLSKIARTRPATPSSA